MEGLTREQLGKRLNRAETAIGVGRRAVRELQGQEPVDYKAIEVQRTSIVDSRLERNDLRRLLKEEKIAEALRNYSWVSRGSERR